MNARYTVLMVKLEIEKAGLQSLFTKCTQPSDPPMHIAIFLIMQMPVNAISYREVIKFVIITPPSFDDSSR